MVELLVVLVITGMTTSLLVTGLNTTWQNFDRLSNKNLTQSQGQLPKSWFIKSVNAALLGHPDKPMFEGTPESFVFTTFMTPNDALMRPQEITWHINYKGENAMLSFVYQEWGKINRNVKVDIWQFSDLANITFEYLVNNSWIDNFSPEKGELPKAIRIKHDTQVWTMATVYRPTTADIPAEIPLFGKYEFE